MEFTMSDHSCVVQDCQGKFYAPAGTGQVCQEHFINFLTWRRRKGPVMFNKYAAMTMEERNAVTEEWKKTVKVIE